MKLSDPIAFCKSCVVGSEKSFLKALHQQSCSSLCPCISADISNVLSDFSFTSTALLHCLSFAPHERKRCNRHINPIWGTPSESNLATSGITTWVDFVLGKPYLLQDGFFLWDNSYHWRPPGTMAQANSFSEEAENWWSVYLLIPQTLLCTTNLKRDSNIKKTSRPVAMCYNPASCCSGPEIWLL